MYFSYVYFHTKFIKASTFQHNNTNNTCELIIAITVKYNKWNNNAQKFIIIVIIVIIITTTISSSS